MAENDIDEQQLGESEEPKFTETLGEKKGSQQEAANLKQDYRSIEEEKLDKDKKMAKYVINDKNRYSGYHKNLGVSYPNKADIKKAKLLGKSPGGDIKIHGLPNKMGFIHKFHRWLDLTHGCMMVTNEEVDELFNAVEIGTPIEIMP